MSTVPPAHASPTPSLAPVAIYIWPLGKVIFALPLAFTWILMYLLTLSGVQTPWYARISALLTAVTLVVVFMDFRRNLFLVSTLVLFLGGGLLLQILGMAVLWDMRDAAERFGTGYAAEWNFLLALLIIAMTIFDFVDTCLNRRILVTESQIQLLRPGDGQKLFDLNQVMVEVQLSDWLEYAILGTGTIWIYAKNGPDKGALVAVAEHVRHAGRIYDEIQRVIKMN